MQPDAKVRIIAQVIQLAVAPVFLLTGLGAVLGVLTNRLGRIVDRARQLEACLSREEHLEQSGILADIACHARRARLIHRAISLCTTSALLVCSLVALLFLGAFLSRDVSVLVALLFIAAMFAFISALLFFLWEIHLAIGSVHFRSR